MAAVLATHKSQATMECRVVSVTGSDGEQIEIGYGTRDNKLVFAVFRRDRQDATWKFVANLTGTTTVYVPLKEGQLVIHADEYGLADVTDGVVSRKSTEEVGRKAFLTYIKSTRQSYSTDDLLYFSKNCVAPYDVVK